MKPDKVKPNTPQKYGYAHKVIPIRKRIWQKVLIRWAVVLGIGVAFIGLCLIAKPMFRNFPSRYRLSWMLTGFLYLYVFLKSRVLPLTFAREWTGVIRDRRVDKYTRYPKGIYQPWGGDRAVLSTKCTWTVVKDDEDIEQVDFDTEEISEGYFKTGERVRMYKNAKILVKANPRRDDENLMCPLCGVMVMEPICRKCGVDFTEAEEPAAEDAATD
jgi:hypothetical protein